MKKCAHFEETQVLFIICHKYTAQKWLRTTAPGHLSCNAVSFQKIFVASWEYEHLDTSSFFNYSLPQPDLIPLKYNNNLTICFRQPIMERP